MITNFGSKLKMSFDNFFSAKKVVSSAFQKLKTVENVKKEPLKYT